jgi:iron complex outermembrane receptor protein
MRCLAPLIVLLTMVAVADDATVGLIPIVVTSSRRDTTLDRTPYAVSVLGAETIQLARPTITLDESLVSVPGLLIQNRHNFAQDLRVSVRGFGARAAFGIRGVKLLVDGVPETLPDGQTQVDSLDIGSTKRIEVIRGPTSVLYGNASGGVIALTTESGARPSFLSLRSTFGSYGLAKHHLKTGGETERMSYLFSMSSLKLDGFREHSRTENRRLSGKVVHTFSPDSDLTTLVNFVDSPVSFDPGALTEEQTTEESAQASAQNVSHNAGESVTQGRFAAVYRRRGLKTRLYGLFRDFRQSLPIDRAVDFDRFSGGAGAQYDLHHDPGVLSVGVEVQHQADDRRNFDNPEAAPGEELRLHQDEEVTNLGIFALGEAYIGDNAWLSFGARYDRVRFSVEDLLLSDGDGSGERTLDAVSPAVGVVWSVRPGLRLYGNVSTSFETPTTTELANRPDGAGGFNVDLEPQRATSVEVGLKAASSLFRTDVAIYAIDVEDKLIPFEDAGMPGRTFFRNAGSATHRGIEVSAMGKLTDGFTATLAYTLSDFIFNQFHVDDSVFDGNRIPGVPPHQLHAALTLEQRGVFGGIEALFVDSIDVDDANSQRNAAYTVISARVGTHYRRGGTVIEPFFGVNNLFDTAYNGSVRINAFGGRYYEPAPGITLYGGISVREEFL